MPTVLRIEGFRFFFFSNEGQEPSHIHVERDGNLAKFWLHPVELAYNYGYNGATINRTRALVLDNREFLLEA